jgi:hypothetical protein
MNCLTVLQVIECLKEQLVHRPVHRCSNVISVYHRQSRGKQNNVGTSRVVFITALHCVAIKCWERADTQIAASGRSHNDHCIFSSNTTNLVGAMSIVRAPYKEQPFATHCWACHRSTDCNVKHFKWRFQMMVHCVGRHAIHKNEQNRTEQKLTSKNNPNFV